MFFFLSLYPHFRMCPNEKEKSRFIKIPDFENHISRHIRNERYWVADSIYSICVLLDVKASKKCIDFFGHILHTRVNSSIFIA